MELRKKERKGGCTSNSNTKTDKKTERKVKGKIFADQNNLQRTTSDL